MNESSRPVVAFDFDGVIRIPNARPGMEYRDNILTAEIAISEDAFPAEHHMPPLWDRHGLWRERHSFSGVAVDWIRTLLDRDVEVVWATTWVDYVNQHFAGPLGLPPRPVAVVNDGIHDEDAIIWKARQLAEYRPGHPLLWIDDEVEPTWAGAFHLARRQGGSDATRYHRVTDRERGFTRSDVDACEQWLARWL